MTPLLVLFVLVAYFAALIVIAFYTSRNATNATFFTANKTSPWYLVAFGMIGASLSGVTFVSVPGWVGNTAFSYYQMVLGYMLGYVFIAQVLMPLYYKLNLVSIYTYLQSRFGKWSYKTGSALFLISRTIGSAFRLYLSANILYMFLFEPLGINYYITVLITIILIWVYTFKGGIKTLVWTDTFQSFFLVAALIVSIYILIQRLDLSWATLTDTIVQSPMSNIFVWDWHSPHNFFKQFIGGAFIAICMTGLDQDLMQKNLTCRNIKDAQKNMYWFSSSLLLVNLLFLCLGLLLYKYIEVLKPVLNTANSLQFDAVKGVYTNTDYLFPELAVHHFSTFAGIVFLLGIIASTYASADSALTSLTTAFCIDFLHLNEDNKKNVRTRNIVHIGFSLLLFLVILIFNAINDRTVIEALFKVAGYTYGPLLGLFFFGLFTRLSVFDAATPFIAVLAPVLCYFLNESLVPLFGGFGFALLLVNGAITFLLLLVSNRFVKQK